MSRQIKFRVITPEGVYLHEALIDGRWRWKPANEDSWKVSGWETKVAPDAVREQFTGLTDKNGTEIYDGDIIQFTKPYQRSKAKVEWDSEMASFVFGGWAEGEFPPLNKYAEVIGNIHENKELLK